MSDLKTKQILEDVVNYILKELEKICKLGYSVHDMPGFKVCIDILTLPGVAEHIPKEKIQSLIKNIVRFNQENNQERVACGLCMKCPEIIPKCAQLLKLDKNFALEFMKENFRLDGDIQNLRDLMLK